MVTLEGVGNSGKNFRCQNILKIPAVPAAYGPSFQNLSNFQIIQNIQIISNFQTVSNYLKIQTKVFQK